MFLAPDGDEIEIANAAAEFLKDVMPIARLHANAPDMSDTMRITLGEMGWFALSVPQSAGGSGLTAVEHALFFREVGRLCGPVDILAQCLAAMLPVSDDARSEILAGEQGVCLVVADGSAYRVLGSPTATLGLHADRDGAALVSLSDAVRTPRPGLDPATSMQLLDSRPAPIATLPGEHIWRMGQLGVAAMLIGVAEAALQLISEYAKVRETFGRKIGAYQAVRHPIANMALAAEVARCQLWYAAAAIKEGRSDADVHLDAAKHLANTSAIGNADTGIQLHGGIGVTDEHDAHLLLKHALLLGKLFGTKRALLARLVNARVEG